MREQCHYEGILLYALHVTIYQDFMLLNGLMLGYYMQKILYTVHIYKKGYIDEIIIIIVHFLEES